MQTSILLYYIYPLWWTYEYLVRKKKLLVKDSIPGAFVSSAKLSLGALST